MALSVDSIRRFAGDYEATWNSGDPKQVAACYAKSGVLVINRGTPWEGRARIAEMAAGFFVNVKNMRVILDELRAAGDHVAFIWTFTGQHAATGKPLDVKGWEKWDLDVEGGVLVSRGWFEAEDYARHMAGQQG